MTIHLIVGPVGAGKSTFARSVRAQHRAVLLVLDDWMARLYGADERPETGASSGTSSAATDASSRSAP